MADFTAGSITSRRNSLVELPMLACQASQTIDCGTPGDSKTIIIYNGNDANVDTATITVSPGDGYFAGYPAGTASYAINGGTYAVLLPHEYARFKNSAGKMTIGVAVTHAGTVSNVKMMIVNLP
jgi:hypothetical protein